MNAHPVPEHVPNMATASVPDSGRTEVPWRLGITLLVSVFLHALLVVCGAKFDASSSSGEFVQIQSAGELAVQFRNMAVLPSQASHKELPQHAVASLGLIGSSEPAVRSWDFGSSRNLPGLYDVFTPRQDLNWYAANELDVRAEPLVEIDPVQPPDERVKSGYIYLEVFIDEFGLTDHVDVIGADPPGYYDSSARRVFMDARWTPALKDGRFVRSRKLIEVCFGDCPGLGFKKSVNPFEGGLD